METGALEPELAGAAEVEEAEVVAEADLALAEREELLGQSFATCPEFPQKRQRPSERRLERSSEVNLPSFPNLSA